MIYSGSMLFIFWYWLRLISLAIKKKLFFYLSFYYTVFFIYFIISINELITIIENPTINKIVLNDKYTSINNNNVSKSKIIKPIPIKIKTSFQRHIKKGLISSLSKSSAIKNVAMVPNIINICVYSIVACVHSADGYLLIEV